MNTRLALGAAALAAAVGAALWGGMARADTAATPRVVGAYGCIAGGGHRTVPAGSTIVVRNGWETSELGSVVIFQKAQISLVSVDDGQMLDVSDRYGPAQTESPFGWATYLFYPTGVTLAAPGDSMRFTFTLLFTRQVVDLADLDGDGNPDPVRGSPGLAFGGTCTVTAA